MNKPRTEQIVLEALRSIGATKPGYFGAITFNFKAGRITHVREDCVHVASEFNSTERTKENLYDGNHNTD